MSKKTTLTDDTSITINGKTYNHKAKDISVGNNTHIKAPVFDVNENNHLLVSNLYLITEAIDGVSEVESGNDTFKVTLEGLNSGSTLTITEVKGVNTQLDRINTVTFDGDKNIVQTSNNGKHMIGITLEANGVKIVSPTDVVYSLGTDGNLGMTSPENSGNNGVYYTYGIYMKYKNGDYTAADAKDKVLKRKLIVPGKGSVDVVMTLHAKEYISE